MDNEKLIMDFKAIINLISHEKRILILHENRVIIIKYPILKLQYFSFYFTLEVEDVIFFLMESYLHKKFQRN